MTGKGLRFDIHAQDKTGRAFDQIKQRTQQTSKSFNGLQTAIRGAVTVAAMRQVINYADRWSQLQSRLRLVTSETGNLEAASRRLYDIAQSTRSDLGATVTLYQRLTFATKDLGIAQEEIYKFTEQLNKQLVVGGLSAEEAAGSIFQLTQAFNKGKLDGDEFRTILESAPPILEALQESLGKTKGEILEMSKAGQLTPKVLIDAVNEMAEVTDQRFGEIPVTVESSLQKLENAFTKFLGSEGPIASYVQNLAYGLEGIVDIIDGIGQAMSGLRGAIRNALEGHTALDRAAWDYKAKEGGFVTEATFADGKEPGSEIDKALKAAGLPGFIEKTNVDRATGATKKLSAAEKQHNDMLKEKEKILDALRTPLDDYNDKIAMAESLLSQGILTTDEFTKYQEKLADEFEKVGDSAEVNAKIIKDHFADALESALFDFENFGDAAKNILIGIVQQLSQKNIIDPIAGALDDAISGGGGGLLDGIGGNLFGGMGDLFGGFFADGGKPPLGKVSVVGERGPELFVPKSAGTILPNHMLNGKPGNVYHIDARGTDASVVRRLEQALMALAGPGVVEQRVVNAQARGSI